MTITHPDPGIPPRYVLQWCVTTYFGNAPKPRGVEWHIMDFDTITEAREYVRQLASTAAFAALDPYCQHRPENPRALALFDLHSGVRVKLPAWTPMFRRALAKRRRNIADNEARRTEREREAKRAELERLKRELGEM